MNGDPNQMQLVDPAETMGTLDNMDMDAEEEVSTVVRLDSPLEVLEEHFIPDRTHEAIEVKKFQWDITNWNELEARTVSQEYQCGGHTWRFLLFPRGNNVNDMVSLYIEVVKDKETDPDWHVCAQFALFISNPHDPTNYIHNAASHRFQADESDWGFTRFAAMRNITQKSYTTGRAILENNTTRLTAIVRVVKDPTGVLWHNFLNYDSKKFTGYVGLKNQGATCYMNSLLQSLFFTNYFRRAVFQIPTEDDEPTNSVTLALQRVFYNLQTSSTPVDTTELTKSFGWDSLDSFMQHDVQEFNRVLQDNLEGKMKNTAAEGTIDKLFLGKMKSYVRCINVDFESSRVENYYDIQLNVKGCKTLRDSFADYIAEETLDGDNKYMAEGYGLQDAKKGVIFESFPPVLHLQLKRFEYNIMQDMMVKINDRHEFPLEIDLEEFLSENADKSKPHKYILHGVLVHSGDLHGGHYFALLKPEKNGKWFKFDDDRVTPVTEKEVLEDNFGGEVMGQTGGMGIGMGIRPSSRMIRRYTNAYMLVYIRESELDNVLCPVKEEDIPEHLVRRIQEEKEARELAKREAEERQLSMEIYVVTDKHLSVHHGFDMVDFNQPHNNANYEIVRVRRDSTYGNFRKVLAERFGIPEKRSRLWVFVNRQNKTIRIDSLVPDIHPNTIMEQFRLDVIGKSSILRLYIEQAKDDSSPFPVIDAKPTRSSKAMLFIKFYDPYQQLMQYIGTMYVSLSDKVATILPKLRAMRGLSDDTPLLVYEEIRPRMIEEFNLDATFQESEIQSGDIVCFQIALPSEELEALRSRALATIPDYFDYIEKLVIVTFRPKPNLNADDLPEKDVQLSRDMKYDEVAEAVGSALNLNPMRLQFTQASQAGIHRLPIQRDPKMCLNDMLPPARHYDIYANVLFYEVLDVDITEFETKRSIKVTWLGLNNSEETSYSLLVLRDGTVYDLIQTLKPMVKFSAEGGSGKIRVYTVSNNRIMAVLDETTPISRIGSHLGIFAEEIPASEADTFDDERTFHVFWFTKEPSRAHGNPFVVKAYIMETVGELKRRLQIRSGLSEKEFEKVRVALLTNCYYGKAEYLDDDDVKLGELGLQGSEFIGLDYSGRSSRNTGRFIERAIKIFN